jgi:exopolysaccharide biosynthesis polyprenyl glycosylphosphotransferase
MGMLFSSSVLRREAHRLHALPPGQAALLALKQAAVVAACVFALMFAIKDRAISRLFLGSYLVLLASILAVLHSRLPRFFARLLFPENIKLRTLFVGRKSGPSALRSWSINREHLGIQIIGYMAEVIPAGDIGGDVPYLGPASGLEDVLHEQQITQVILLDWLDEPSEMERLVSICEKAGCRLLIHNDFSSRFSRKVTSMDDGGQNFFVVQDEPLEDPVNRMLKRTLDIGIALPVVVVILVPLSLVVWVVQRFQAPGELMFVRPRKGRQRHPFVMYKFRSMYEHPGNGTQQATATDPRVYPFGRFLRRRSLDELPQFINVLKGEMTLVGPRPHLPEHDEIFSHIDHSYRIRSLIKPGLTGLAQIQGFRGEITEPGKLRQRIHWDLYYLVNWSIWMDLRIITLTAVQVVFPPKTAY